MFEKSKLANGLRVVTEHLPHTRSASVQFYVAVGARHESPALSGISHFVEHMVFKGTERRPNPVMISEAIEGVGGMLDAATDHEHTNFRVLVPSDYLGTALEVLTDMMRAPRFLESDIDRERQVILEEISSTFDSPGEIVDLVFDGLLWGKHPLGQDIAGTKRSLKNIGRAELFEHLHAHYSPDRLVISVAGSIKHSDVVERIGRLWGDAVPSGGLSNETSKPTAPAATRPSIKVHRKRTEQSNVVLGFPAYSYLDPERHAQDVLDAILGAGMSSRLFVEIRENRGLAYSVASFVKTYHDVGAFGVHAAVDNGAVTTALEGIIGELDRIRNEKVPGAELTKVKAYIRGHTLLGLERSGYVAHWNGWQELMLGEIQDVDQVLEKIDAVTVDDVQTLARELFVSERAYLAVVGPSYNEDSLREELKIAT